MCESLGFLIYHRARVSLPTARLIHYTLKYSVRNITHQYRAWFSKLFFLQYSRPKFLQTFLITLRPTQCPFLSIPPPFDTVKYFVRVKIEKRKFLNFSLH